MASLDQQEYMEVGALPPNPPWWKTPRGVRNVLLAAGGALVVVLLVVFVVNVITHSGDTTEDRLAAALAACEQEEDPAVCIERVRKDAARNGEGADACEGLSGSSYASCVTLAAYESADPDVCDPLSDDARTACRDSALFARGMQEKSIEDCQAIENADDRPSCLRKVTEMIVDEGACVQYGVPVHFCEAADAVEAAVAQGTVEACEALDDAGSVESCIDELFGSDDDLDGLSAYDEARQGTSDTDEDSDDDGLTDGEEVDVYGSDPKNPDSDGDGFNDGTEVESGYSPIG